MRSIRALAGCALSASLLWGMAAHAQSAAPVLANIFADHAVLQRDRPIAIWGSAAPGTPVTVKLGDRSVTAQTGSDGKWRATLPAMPAGGPYVLEVSSGTTAAQRLSDIMVGDVFL